MGRLWIQQLLKGNSIKKLTEEKETMEKTYEVSDLHCCGNCNFFKRCSYQHDFVKPHLCCPNWDFDLLKLKDREIKETTSEKSREPVSRRA
jgi:hypothetical protein